MKTAARKAIKRTPNVDKLTAELQQVKSDLSNCSKAIGEMPKMPFSKTIWYTLDVACSSPFMPKYYTDDNGVSKFSSKYRMWLRLQRSLVSSDVLKDFFTKREFREAILQVNNITEGLAIQDVPGLGREVYNKAAESLGGSCAYSYPKKHEGFVMLKEAVELLKASGGGYLTDDELNDVLVSLAIIIQCQSIFMNMKEEPEPKPEKKSKK